MPLQFGHFLGERAVHAHGVDEHCGRVQGASNSRRLHHTPSVRCVRYRGRLVSRTRAGEEIPGERTQRRGRFFWRQHRLLFLKHIHEDLQEALCIRLL